MLLQSVETDTLKCQVGRFISCIRSFTCHSVSAVINKIFQLGASGKGSTNIQDVSKQYGLVEGIPILLQEQLAFILHAIE